MPRSAEASGYDGESILRVTELSASARVPLLGMTTLAHHRSTAALVAAAPAADPAGLLARLRRRERGALTELAGAYAGAMTRVAFLYVDDAHAAEDIAQDALLAAWDSARRTGDDTRLWPWLAGIVLNQCRNHHRTLARRRRREERHHDLKLARDDDAQRSRRDDQLERVRRAMARLSDVQRGVVILRFEQGLTIAETAAALAVPQGTVKRRCHDALRELRRQLMDGVSEKPSASGRGWSAERRTG